MKQQQAFTLVELSIVLVILGLLVGGVLTGQSLIRAAELRSVSTQYSRYITAVQTFRDKYMALPGDMTNAQAYWGIADAAATTCRTTASTDSKTCNGDGNGAIDFSAASNEHFRFWQQLANAGLIEGTYDGIAHGANVYSSTTANSPIGRISGSLWSIYNWASTPGNTGNQFIGVYDNTLVYGGIYTNSVSVTPIFRPEEMYNIDMKMDDGKPALGKVRIFSVGGLENCTTATGGSAAKSAFISADYLLTNTANACSALFPLAF